MKTLTPTLHRVAWLAARLGISDKSVRDAIAAKQVPDECVLRVGARIRIREDKALAWLAGEEAECHGRR